ncbi:S1C family serine protease [Candidatus Poribacteria bacterium]
MQRRYHLLPTTLVIAFTILLTLRTAIAQQTRQQIAQKAFPSVVLLVTEDESGQPVSLGSGFVVRNGIIATNLHVIGDASQGYAKIVGQKQKHEIEGIVGIDSKLDLVLLAATSIEAPLLKLGESAKLNIGDEIYAIGNPKGLEGTFSHGIVSGIRTIDSDNILQITAPISPGSSGGPVLNTSGEVIGVAVATFRSGQNLNFAIPASYLSPLLSNTKSVMPLPDHKQHKQVKSILDDFGGRNTEGVVGTLFEWDAADYAFLAGGYSFSLRNKLRESVSDIYCIVIFYTDDGEPVDFNVVQYREVIPPGLAKRVSGEIEGVVRKIVTKKGTIQAEFEIRILGFQIAE